MQSVQLAAALAAEGLRVRHVVAFANGDPVEPAGVELVRIGSHYFTGGIARRRAVVRAVRDADARVVIQRSAGFETGIVGAVARAMRRRFIFSSSSLGDFMLDPLSVLTAGAGLELRRSRAQYRLGLKLADVTVVQTAEQEELARGRFGLEVELIRSFAQPARTHDGPREGFLWVGALAEVKDPLSYVELARRVPEARFTMIGGVRAGSEVLAEAVRVAAAEVPNLTLLAPPGRAATLEAYGAAVALVSTSRFEGFPNTFLEAWARGTPVLSLRADPDGVVERHRLGVVGHGSIDRLAASIRALAAEPPDEAARTRVADYVRREHDPSVVGPQWAQLVRRFLR